MAKNILPDVDLINSREYYGAYNSKDLYKGKSFNMTGEWATNAHYFNDDFVVDFVAYKGALLSCKRSHQSSSQNAPELLTKDVNGVPVPYGVAQNSYWTFVMGAIPGTQGDTGKVYVPSYNEASGELTWSLEDTPVSIDAMRIKGSGIEDIYDEANADGTKQIVTIVYDGGEKEIVEIPHGKDGSKLIDVEQHKTNFGYTYVFKFRDWDGTIRNYSVNVENGAKGDKGDDGKSATVEVVSVKKLAHGSTPTVKNVGTESDVKLEFGLPEAPEAPEFKLEYTKDGYDNLSVNLLWSSDNKGTWTNLGSIGGKSPKLMRVLSSVEDADIQDDTRRNDRIIWGYDGVDVSTWSTLCMLDDLRGDENIWIGNTPPMMQDGVTEDHDKIWFDTSDEAIGEFSASDILYTSYLEMGGELSKEEFAEAFKGINNKNGFEVKFAESFEALPEPTVELLNQLWYVPGSSTSESNLFEEYIVVHSPAKDIYMWEKWGSGTLSVNLDNYYTKDQVNQYVSSEISKVESNFDGGHGDDISGWE